MNPRYTAVPRVITYRTIEKENEESKGQRESRSGVQPETPNEESVIPEESASDTRDTDEEHCSINKLGSTTPKETGSNNGGKGKAARPKRNERRPEMFSNHLT